jgi:hypothetical protein
MLSSKSNGRERRLTAKGQPCHDRWPPPTKFANHGFLIMLWDSIVTGLKPLPSADTSIELLGGSANVGALSNAPPLSDCSSRVHHLLNSQRAYGKSPVSEIEIWNDPLGCLNTAIYYIFDTVRPREARLLLARLVLVANVMTTFCSMHAARRPVARIFTI